MLRGNRVNAVNAIPVAQHRECHNKNRNLGAEGRQANRERSGDKLGAPLWFIQGASQCCNQKRHIGTNAARQQR